MVRSTSLRLASGFVSRGVSKKESGREEMNDSMDLTSRLLLRGLSVSRVCWAVLVLVSGWWTRRTPLRSHLTSNGCWRCKIELNWVDLIYFEFCSNFEITLMCLRLAIQVFWLLFGCILEVWQMQNVSENFFIRSFTNTSNSTKVAYSSAY